MRKVRERLPVGARVGVRRIADAVAHRLRVFNPFRRRMTSPQAIRGPYLSAARNRHPTGASGDRLRHLESP